MDTREFDRAIDAAAGELMVREPSRALSFNVMARVRGGDVSTPRGAWLKVASVCAAGIVVAYLAMNRSTPEIPTTARPQVLRTELAPVPVPRIEPAQEAHADSRPQSLPRRTAVARRAPLVFTPAAVDVAPIEPIRAEAVAVPAIVVPALEAEPPASIENLTVDALTIEPLAASND